MNKGTGGDEQRGVESTGTADPFERLAPIYDAVFPCVVPKYQEAQDVLISLLPFGREEQVQIVELGCGTGELTLKLAKNFIEARIVAIDVSAAMLGAARRKLSPFLSRIRLLQRDLALPDWHDGIEAVDAIVSAYSLDFLPPDRHERLVAEVFSKLRPKGRFVSCEFVESEDPRVGQVFRDFEYRLITEEIRKGRVTREQIEILAGVSDTGPRHHVVQMGTQLRWLRENGFARIDVPWRFFNFAIICAEKP